MNLEYSDVTWLGTRVTVWSAEAESQCELKAVAIHQFAGAKQHREHEHTQRKAFVFMKSD